MIIFDFNRTIFDPDKSELFVGAKEIIEDYSKKHELILYCKGNDARKKFIYEHPIFDLFKELIIVDEKDIKDIERLVDRYGKGWMVGDRVKKEIMMGNRCGMKTIWLKRGKFSTELPENKDEEPDYIIETLEGIKNII